MNKFCVEDILYEDSVLLVCRKHAGMAVQSAKKSQIDMESALKNYLAQQDANAGQIPYLGVIQRLDQPVEGVLVFAKTPKAAAKLNQQMGERKFEKYYLVMVEDEGKQPQGVLEDYLLKDGRTNTSKVVGSGVKGSKQARLSYRTVSKQDTRVLLEVQLETGRHHQIRVQLAHAGMPIVGDGKYNPQTKAGQQLALCAYRLKLHHPENGKKLAFEIKPENIIFSGKEACK